MTIKYTKLAADGTDLSDDATGHLAVRIERDILAQPIILTAHRSPKTMTWPDATKWADALDIYGWSWRLPTIEEAVLLVDYSRTSTPLLPPDYFPDCENEWSWTGSEDLTPPSGFARCVLLCHGGSDFYRQSGRFHVRAVRAGQF